MYVVACFETLLYSGYKSSEYKPAPVYKPLRSREVV